MKEKYIAPELDIVLIDKVDVITTSLTIDNPFKDENDMGGSIDLPDLAF